MARVTLLHTIYSAEVEKHTFVLSLFYLYLYSLVYTLSYIALSMHVEEHVGCMVSVVCLILT